MCWLLFIYPYLYGGVAEKIDSKTQLHKNSSAHTSVKHRLLRAERVSYLF